MFLLCTCFKTLFLQVASFSAHCMTWLRMILTKMRWKSMRPDSIAVFCHVLTALPCVAMCCHVLPSVLILTLIVTYVPRNSNLRCPQCRSELGSYFEAFSQARLIFFLWPRWCWEMLRDVERCQPVREVAYVDVSCAIPTEFLSNLQLQCSRLFWPSVKSILHVCTYSHIVTYSSWYYWLYNFACNCKINCAYILWYWSFYVHLQGMMCMLLVYLHIYRYASVHVHSSIWFVTLNMFTLQPESHSWTAMKTSLLWSFGMLFELDEFVRSWYWYRLLEILKLGRHVDMLRGFPGLFRETWDSLCPRARLPLSNDRALQRLEVRKFLKVLPAAQTHEVV